MTKRTNSDWINYLSGKGGNDGQSAAYQDLGRYLWRVAYNYLTRRQAESNPFSLGQFSTDELATLAFDFTQDMLERIAQDQFALLAQFKGYGRFTSWMAVILHRHISRDLSRAHWQRNQPLTVDESNPNSGESQLDIWAKMSENSNPQTASPSRQTEHKQLMEILAKCIQGLHERRRLAFLGCIIEELSAQEVADRMMTSTSSIFNLVMRAKKDVKSCMESQISADDIFQVFQ